jgi:hypothetical protein
MTFIPHKKTDAAAFKSLETVLMPYGIVGRTPSVSMLIWFLQTIFRLDEVESQDAVCDKKLDKGIDALFVNDGDEEIVLFQAKRSSTASSTLGDTDLKDFIGSLAQFRKESSVAALASTTKNSDLKRLLTDNNVAAKIGSGYQLHPVFVTNLAANTDAEEYLKLAPEAGDQIDLWDLQRISPILLQVTKQEWFVAEKALLKLDPELIYVQGDDAAKPDLVVAAISAKELVKLTGISDTRIFAQNVRLGLGKTRVNTELIASIRDAKEHPKFLASHNGLTIVAKSIAYTKGNISIEDYSVSNGCQSLLSLFNNQTSITNKLILPVRIVKVGDDRSLAASIAYKTNNQNPISLRDLSANDSTQTLLKAEFDNLFGFDCTYMIKQGSTSKADEFPNELAGQILLSLYAQQPWSAHQKYKIFGEFQNSIFRYGVSASHIRFAQLSMRACKAALINCKDERVRSYGLTSFIVLYIVGELLRADENGNSVLDNPGPFLRTAKPDKTRNKLETKLLQEVSTLASYTVTELNYYIEDSGGEAFDYKSVFKSEKGVKLFRSEVLKAYEKDLFRDKVDAFKMPQVTVPASPASSDSSTAGKQIGTKHKKSSAT